MSWGATTQAPISLLDSTQHGTLFSFARSLFLPDLVHGFRQDVAVRACCDAEIASQAPRVMQFLMSAVPAHKRQSISQGRGVLHALLHRRSGEQVVVVMDPQYPPPLPRPQQQNLKACGQSTFSNRRRVFTGVFTWGHVALPKSPPVIRSWPGLGKSVEMILPLLVANPQVPLHLFWSTANGPDL